MAGVDLTEADLTEADLSGVNLQEANLTKAKLNMANLQQTNLKKADLRNVNLQQADLRKGDLQSANLKNANLKSANLAEANLSKANLGQVNLSQANLGQTNLQQANLENANLAQSNLQETNFNETNLNNICIEHWHLDDLTVFNQVDCETIWLNNLLQNDPNVIELSLKIEDPINWTAFLSVCKSLKFREQQNELSFIGIKYQPSSAVILQIKLAEELDISALEMSLVQKYKRQGNLKKMQHKRTSIQSKPEEQLEFNILMYVVKKMSLSL